MMINNFISMIMKYERNEDMISGWANESDPNIQAFTLRKVSKPKTTINLLPQIILTENRPQANHRKQLSNRQLPLKGKNTISQSNGALNVKRKQTERSQKQENAYIKTNNNKLYDLVKQQSSALHFSPLHYAKRSQAIFQRYSKIPEDEQFHRYHEDYVDADINNLTLGKNKKHGNNTKSHDYIANSIKKEKIIKKTIELNEPIKMTEMKFYVKLNTLQMVGDVRKQVNEQSFHKTSLKKCFSEQRSSQLLVRKKKISSKLGTETIQKMNQKMRQTFIKQNVFKKGQQHQRSNRAQKFQSNLQFSDQLIFSNHFLAINRPNPSQVSQPKIQQLHLPQRHRLVFK